jgi:hypothetical protein
VVQTGCFEKFLDMVLWLSRLALEVTLDGCDILIRVASFLIVAVIIGHDSDTLGASHLPLLATVGAFSITLDGGFGWWCSTAASGRFRVA